MSKFADGNGPPLLTNPSFAAQRDQYNQWKYCEVISTMFAVGGIAAQIWDYEERYADDRTYDNCAQKEIGERYRWLCVLCTVVSVTFQVFRHHTKHMWELFKAKTKLSTGDHYKAKSSLFTTSLFVDVVLLCVFPYPHLRGCFHLTERCMWEATWEEAEVCYTLSEALFVLMFGRLYLLLRCAFAVFGMTDRHSRTVSAQFGIKANTRFTIRSLLRQRPYTTLLLLWAPISLVLALLFRVFERPYMDCSGLDFTPYYNGLWLAMMTITTVNYADYWPSTHLGRVVAMLGGIWGLFLISLMVFVMARNFALTWSQQKALFRINRTRFAAKVVIAGIQWAILKGKRSSLEEKREKWQELQRKVRDFRENRSVINTLYEETCTEVTDVKPILDGIRTKLTKNEQKIDNLLIFLQNQSKTPQISVKSSVNSSFPLYASSSPAVHYRLTAISAPPSLFSVYFIRFFPTLASFPAH